MAWSRGEKWLIVGSVLLCLPLLVGSWVYERQNELPPHTEYKEEVEPANNAFNSVLQAIALAPKPPSPRRTKAGCQSSDIDWEYTCDEGFSAPQPYTPEYNRAFPLASKIAYLKPAQNSLKLWRASLPQPLFMPSEMSSTHYRLWGHRGQLMSLARTQARACWQSGDNAGARNWLLSWHREACRTATTHYKSESLIRLNQLLASERQRAMVMDELERLSPYLDARQCRHAAVELQRNRSLLPTLIQALEKDRNFALERAYRICQGKWDGDPSLDPTKSLRFRWANKKAGLARIKKQWDWCVEQEKLPPAMPFSPGAQLPEGVVMQEGDPFQFLSVPNFSDAYGKMGSLDINTREVVWETAMAARAYTLAKGHAPGKLSALVPEYLKKVENDPYDPTRQLRYAPHPKTYAQYYVGRPIFKKPLPADAIPALPEAYAYAPGGAPPMGATPPVLGYHVVRAVVTIPFVLYSVGADGRDEGGKDFKAAATKPNLLQTISVYSGDDVFAPPQWFKVSAMLEECRSNLYGARAARP